MTEMTDEEIHEFLAIEIHTALRKYVQVDGAVELWDAISKNLPAYNEAIEFAIVRMHEFGISMRVKEEPEHSENPCNCRGPGLGCLRESR